MRFATFLKNIRKNCQRIRDKFLYEESKKLNIYQLNIHEKEKEAVYLVRKYLDEQLTPYGIIGSWNILDIIIRTNLNKRALKRLGKAALRKGQFLYLKDVLYWYWDNRCLTGTPKRTNGDMREIPFRELDIEKYRSLKYNDRSMGLNYRADPF